MWGATCPNTFAPTLEPGKVAAAAKERKEEKYSSLPPSRWFSPITIETMGAVGPKSMALLKDVGHCIVVETGDPQASDYLFQCFLVAVQRGNCDWSWEQSPPNPFLNDLFFYYYLFIYLLLLLIYLFTHLLTHSSSC